MLKFKFYLHCTLTVRLYHLELHIHVSVKLEIIDMDQYGKENLSFDMVNLQLY